MTECGVDVSLRSFSGRCQSEVWKCERRFASWIVRVKREEIYSFVVKNVRQHDDLVCVDDNCADHTGSPSSHPCKAALKACKSPTKACLAFSISTGNVSGLVVVRIVWKADIDGRRRRREEGGWMSGVVEVAVVGKGLAVLIMIVA